MSIINTLLLSIPIPSGTWLVPPVSGIEPWPNGFIFEAFQDGERQSFVRVSTAPTFANPPLYTTCVWSLPNASLHFPSWFLSSHTITMVRDNRYEFVVRYFNTTDTLILTILRSGEAQQQINNMTLQITNIEESIEDLEDRVQDIEDHLNYSERVVMNVQYWSNPFSSSIGDVEIVLVKTVNTVFLTFPTLNPTAVTQTPSPNGYLSLRPRGNAWPDGEWPPGFKPNEDYLYVFPDLYDPQLERHVLGITTGSMTAGYPLDQPKLRLNRESSNGELFIIYANWNLNTPDYLDAWSARWPSTNFSYISE